MSIGGDPATNKPEFVPSYPGSLPMCVQEGLEVHLRRLSLTQVHDVFMQIEEPEEPIDFPALPLEAIRPPEAIGQFYQSIQALIGGLGDSTFDPAHRSRQVLGWFGSELFPIIDAASAIRAIDQIIEQGEGTPDSPVDPEGELAHYYKFSEIYHRKRLVKDASVPEGYSYSGAPLEFSDNDVYNMMDDPATSKYPSGSRAEFLSTQFNRSYRKLLNALHSAFNGEPGDISQAIGLMYSLKLQAIELMQTPADSTVASGPAAGPSFEFVAAD